MSSELNTAVNIITVTGTDGNDCHYYYTAENRDPTATVDGAMNEKVNTKIDEKLEQSVADVSDVDALFGEA